MWQPSPLFGALAGDLFRYSVASALVLIVGLILGFRAEGGAIGVVLAVALVLVFCFALSWLWIIVGMLVRTPESVVTTSFVFLMPLTFASDIFVDLSTMPGWLQAVGARGVGGHRSCGFADRNAVVPRGAVRMLSGPCRTDCRP